MAYLPENVTAEQRAEAFKLIRLAISDPGTFVDREHDEESVTNWSARAVVAAFDAHPLLEVRRYHPTTSAYEGADRAVWKHRKRADDAESKLKQIRDQHGRPRTDRHGSGCVHCAILWPCPTYKLATVEAGRADASPSTEEGDRG
jgi:hypothetical protein